jgi:tripeptidyl-peptidase-1
MQNITSNIGGHNSSNTCVANVNNCLEANLDVQYLLAVSGNVPTLYNYDNTSNDFLLQWAVNLLELDDPPLVNSVSYGIYEVFMDYAYIAIFEDSALMLSALGVTIVVSSGDDGVAGYIVGDNPSVYACDYYPSWPATSPYVLAVGGTQGPEVSGAEIACSSATSGVITTGGGFSNLYPQPPFQRQTVGTYLAKATTSTSQKPASGYNATGRGYPDVSLMARNYIVRGGGSWIIVSGTVRDAISVVSITHD